MEHIQLSSEARERILSNVSIAMEEKDAGEKNEKIVRFPGWKRLGALAACFVAFLIGAFVVNYKPVQVIPDNGVPLVVSPVGMEEYASAAELSDAVGFPLEDVSAIPFDMNNFRYEKLPDNLAQETAQYGDCEITFRKAAGDADISGDYNVYAVTKAVTIDGVAVTLKGSEEQFTLAAWKKEGYSYSLDMKPPAPEGDMIAVVESLIRQ